MLTNKLREQLGEDADIDDEPEDHIKEVEIKEKAFESLQTGENYQTLIDAIDAQLKKPDLTDEEMDSLLDKRQKLKFNSLKA